MLITTQKYLVPFKATAPKMCSTQPKIAKRPKETQLRWENSVVRNRPRNGTDHRISRQDIKIVIKAVFHMLQKMQKRLNILWKKIQMYHPRTSRDAKDTGWGLMATSDRFSEENISENWRQSDGNDSKTNTERKKKLKNKRGAQWTVGQPQAAHFDESGKCTQPRRLVNPTVTCHRDGDQARLCVWETGHGKGAK